MVFIVCQSLSVQKLRINSVTVSYVQHMAQLGTLSYSILKWMHVISWLNLYEKFCQDRIEPVTTCLRMHINSTGLLCLVHKFGLIELLLLSFLESSIFLFEFLEHIQWS